MVVHQTYIIISDISVQQTHIFI